MAVVTKSHLSQLVGRWVGGIEKSLDCTVWGSRGLLFMVISGFEEIWHREILSFESWFFSRDCACGRGIFWKGSEHKVVKKVRQTLENFTLFFWQPGIGLRLI